MLLNADGAGLPAAASVVTDSLRRRVANFGELRTSYSPTLTAAEPARTFEAIGDYTEPGWNRYLSVAQYHGISGVTASSSAADIGAIPGQWASGLLPVRRDRREHADHVGVGQLGRPGRPVDPVPVRIPGRSPGDPGRLRRPALRSGRR